MDRHAYPSQPSRIHRSRTAALAIAMVCGALASHLRAQQSAGSQESQADIHFKAGLEKMRQGQFDIACPELLESYRLDPVPGALFTVAECEASWGKPATAIEHYEAFVNMLAPLDQARRDKFDERRRIALEKIGALTNAAPELEIDVAPTAPTHLVVKRNDAVVEASAYGVKKRVDVGRYLVTAELDGRIVWQRQLALAERDKARIDVPWPPLASPRESAAPATKESTSGANGLDKPRADSSSRTWLYVTGGFGALGLTTGLVAGALALGQKSKIDDNCPNQTCNPEGRSAVDRAKREALISTVGFSVGLAGATAATVLLMSSQPYPAEHRSADSFYVRPLATVSTRGGALVLDGEF